MTRDDARPVAVVTNDDDPTADFVIAELHGRGVPVVRLDSGHFPATLSCSAHIGGSTAQWRGSLATPTRVAELDGVRALYYRRPSGFAFPHLDDQDARFAAAQARYGLGGVLVSLPDCLYVNHPNRIGDAEYKPAGLAAAAEAGFVLPPTLITNRPDDARAFVKEHGPVIYKPLRPRCTSSTVRRRPCSSTRSPRTRSTTVSPGPCTCYRPASTRSPTSA